jgi:hypothetical protein
MFPFIDRALHPQAEAYLRSLAELNGEDLETKVLLLRGMADPAQRLAAVQSLEHDPENANLRDDPMLYAVYLLPLGEHSRALDQLETYAAKHNSSFGAYLWWRCFDPIRQDPRYTSALVKLNCPTHHQSRGKP